MVALATVQTLTPEPQTLDPHKPKPCTLNPNPGPLDPTLQTLNPKPQSYSNHYGPYLG